VPVSTPAPLKLEHVIARAMAELRLEKGWTQADLARRMTEVGLSWTPNRVTQLETLRRPVSLYEVAALSWVFEVPVTRLLPGYDRIEAPDGKTVIPLADIRASLAGHKVVHVPGRVRTVVGGYDDEIRKVAQRLDLEPRMLDWLARRLYGRTFIEEREARLGPDIADLPKQSARTKRGHITRTLITDVSRLLDETGREALLEEFMAQEESDIGD